MTQSFESLQNRIDNAMEKSSICRGEWCRSLESEVNQLEDEVRSLCTAEGSCTSQEYLGLEEKIHKCYDNLSPNIHV